MRTYKVSSKVKPFLRKNLLNGIYSCFFFEDERGIQRCKTNASSDVFHKMIVQSRYDLDSKESGVRHIPGDRINCDYFLNGTSSVAVKPITEDYYL